MPNGISRQCSTRFMENGEQACVAAGWCRRDAEAKNREGEAALCVSELRLRQTDLIAVWFFAWVREPEEKRERGKKQTAKSSATRATRFQECNEGDQSYSMTRGTTVHSARTSLATL